MKVCATGNRTRGPEKSIEGRDAKTGVPILANWIRVTYASLNVRTLRLFPIAKCVVVEIDCIDRAGETHTANERELATTRFWFISRAKLRSSIADVARIPLQGIVVDGRVQRRDDVP